MGSASSLPSSSCTLSWIHSTTLLNETVRSNGVNGAVPSLILSLECRVNQSCEQLYQLCLRRPLRRAVCTVHSILDKTITTKLLFDVVHSLFGSLLIPDPLFEISS